VTGTAAEPAERRLEGGGDLQHHAGTNKITVRLSSAASDP
jgi:hypothetical protein